MKKNQLLKDIELLINSKQLDKALQKLEANVNFIEKSNYLAIYAVIEYKRLNFSKAELLFKQALSINTGNLLANQQLAALYLQLKRQQDAKPYVEKVLELTPDDHQARINMAVVCLEDQSYQRVLDLLLPTLDQAGTSTDICAVISAYRSLHDIRSAEKYLAIAEEKFPDASDVKRLRADILSETNPYKAISAFELMFDDPKNAKAVRWNSSFIDLRLRNFERGWANYECGLDKDIGRIGRPLPELMNNLDRVPSVSDIDKDRWLVVCGEQGIGDQVLFLNTLTDLQKITSKIIYLSDSRLIPILRRSYPEISVHQFGVALNLQNHDSIQGYIPVGSLMKDLRPNESMIKESRRPYLVPNFELVQKYRTVLKENAANLPVVGISWKGGFWERAQKTKSLDIEHWTPFLSRKDMVFVSLQYGETSKEQEYCRKNGLNVRFIKGIDFKKNIDEWFALTCACDLVVSVSTAVVHFGAAAGKKVYILLGDKQQPFCWGLTETRSIFYPDVHLVRKSKDAPIEDYFKTINKIFV